MLKSDQKIPASEGGLTSDEVLASSLSFMVERCPEESAEILRRGLYSKEPIVDHLIRVGLHERLGAAAMRNILGDLPWAGEYTAAERLRLLEQMTDTRKGAQVVSSALALVKDDKTLVADYLYSLRRYILEGDAEGRELMTSMLRGMSMSGAEINPRYVVKGRGNSWVETSFSHLMAGSLPGADDDKEFTSRIEAARDFIRAGAQVKEVEIHALQSAVPMDRIPAWLSLFKEEGVNLSSIGKPVDEKLIALKSKSVKVSPVDPDRVALATAWLAQEAIADIRGSSPRPSRP